MKTLGPPDLSCFIHTFKEGLLSAVAHDLRLRCQAFTIEVTEDRVTGRFEAASVVVDTVMRDGAPASGVLGQRDFDKIAGNVRKEVLKASRYPTAIFSAPRPGGAAETFVLDGELELTGTRRPLKVSVRREGDALLATARIHQPDFGIKPYTAMLGALKVKADVDIALRVPVRALEG